MAAKFFYQENTLISVVAGEGASRYLRTKEVILCERTDDISPAMLACELSGTVSVAASSNKVARFRYTPYGRRFEPLPEATQLGFNGEYLFLEVAIYLLGNGYRAYNPDTMRCISPDSISPFQVLNTYSYCGNDPVNNADPSGHIKESHLKKLKTKVRSLQDSNAKILSIVSSFKDLAREARLRDGDMLASNAMKMLQEAYVEAAPARAWLARKFESNKYADRADFIEKVIIANQRTLSSAGLEINNEVASHATSWARKEAEFNAMVQEVRSSVGGMSNVRASDVRETPNNSPSSRR